MEFAFFHLHFGNLKSLIDCILRWTGLKCLLFMAFWRQRSILRVDANSLHPSPWGLVADARFHAHFNSHFNSQFNSQFNVHEKQRRCHGGLVLIPGFWLAWRATTEGSSTQFLASWKALFICVFIYFLHFGKTRNMYITEHLSPCKTYAFKRTRRHQARGTIVSRIATY